MKRRRYRGRYSYVWHGLNSAASLTINYVPLLFAPSSYVSKDRRAKRCPSQYGRQPVHSQGALGAACSLECPKQTSLNKKSLTKKFARYASPPDLLIPTAARLLWESFNHAAITARSLFTHIIPSLYADIYLNTELSESGRRWENGFLSALERHPMRFQPGLPRLRSWRSVVQLPHSTKPLDCVQNLYSILDYTSVIILRADFPRKVAMYRPILTRTVLGILVLISTV